MLTHKEFEEQVAAAQAKELAEREARCVFLKDASPVDVLTWIMRGPDVDPRLQAYCAKALLPYLHPKKDAIDDPDADKS
jgi:hypothetical protein